MCAYNVTPIVYNCNFSINFYCYVVLVFHKTVPVLLKEQPETLYEVAVSEKKKKYISTLQKCPLHRILNLCPLSRALGVVC